MTEDWFEDELPWLGPPPQLPPRREHPRPAPIRRAPPRRLPASSPARVAAPAAVPAFAHVPEERLGDGVALKWIGILLVLVATSASIALILRDARSASDSASAPVGELVIPAAGEPSTADPLAAIVPNPAFQDKTICLDAAHGGVDRGYQRAGDPTAPAMDEALYTSSYARELAAQLSAMGFHVVLTRDGDVVRNSQFQDVNRDGQTRENAGSAADAERNAQIDEMQARIDFCNDAQADLLISLHFDGSSNSAKMGHTTWYAENRPDSADSQRLAQLIDQQLGQALSGIGHPVTGQGVQPASAAVTRGNQMVYDSLFVITGARNGLKEPSKMPGVVADLLTISNAEDAKLLSSQAGRTAIVTAVAQAIRAYFESPAANG